MLLAIRPENRSPIDGDIDKECGIVNEMKESSPYIFDFPVQARRTSQVPAAKVSEDVETRQTTEDADYLASLKWLDWVGYVFIMLTVILGLATVIVQIKLLF